MKKFNSKMLHVAFLIILFIVSGCSSLPSETDAKNDLKKRIDEQSNGKIELIKFEKTNALKQNIFGSEEYIIEFKAQIKLNEAGYISEWLHEIDVFKFYDHPGWHREFYEKDITLNLTGKVDYEKTEKGYRPSSWSKFIIVEK